MTGGPRRIAAIGCCTVAAALLAAWALLPIWSRWNWGRRIANAQSLAGIANIPDESVSVDVGVDTWGHGGPGCVAMKFVCWSVESSCRIMAGPPWDREIMRAPSHHAKGTWALERSAFAAMLDAHKEDLAGCHVARVTSGSGRLYLDLRLEKGRIVSFGDVDRW
jgi:hypothetical protein